MSDEAALLSAIRAHADEDTPRLAYADWLDEHEQPEQAEFVRIQCRLVALSPADPEWATIIDREQDLLWRGPKSHDPLPAPFQHRRTYSPPFRYELAQFFYRGFLFFVAVEGAGLHATDPGRFAGAFAELAATTTARGVQFWSIPAERLAQVIDCLTFAELRGLTFSLTDHAADRGRTVAVWKKLLESPAASRIEQFSSSGELWPEILSAFDSSGAFRNLRRYELPHQLEASPAEIRAWLGAGWARNLRYIHAFASELDKSAAIAEGLAELPELHSLSASTQIAEAVARVPAGFPRLAALRVRDLNVNQFRELLQTAWFGRLRALDLAGAGDQTVSALAKHPVAKELHYLQFHYSPLGKNGLRTIAKPGAFPNLIALHLGGCVGGFRGKKSTTPEEVRAFLSGLNMPRLQVLDLSGWNWSLCDDEARALASNAGLPSLRYLNLRDCHIKDDGKKALADSALGRASIRYS
jgi:uncharacterized protein (TIGR02996 family)